MFKRLYGKKEKKAPTDWICVLDDRTFRMLPVEEHTEEYVSSGGLLFAHEQVSKYHNPDGGQVWVANCPDKATLLDAEKLAGIETSLVLRNVFSYSPPRRDTPWYYIVAIAIVLIVAIIR